MNSVFDYWNLHTCFIIARRRVRSSSVWGIARDGMKLFHRKIHGMMELSCMEADYAGSKRHPIVNSEWYSRSFDILPVQIGRAMELPFGRRTPKLTGAYGAFT
nr:hypothetical protein CFP56_53250 [Quercus suber]